MAAEIDREVQVLFFVFFFLTEAVRHHVFAKVDKKRQTSGKLEEFETTMYRVKSFWMRGDHCKPNSHVWSGTTCPELRLFTKCKWNYIILFYFFCFSSPYTDNILILQNSRFELLFQIMPCFHLNVRFLHSRCNPAHQKFLSSQRGVLFCRLLY